MLLRLKLIKFNNRFKLNRYSGRHNSRSGMTGPISVISREEGSGTRGAFVELMGIVEEQRCNDITTIDAEMHITCNSTEVMLTTVAGNKQCNRLCFTRFTFR